MHSKWTWIQLNELYTFVKKNSFYLHSEVLFIFHFTQLLTAEKHERFKENVCLKYFFLKFSSEEHILKLAKFKYSMIPKCEDSPLDHCFRIDNFSNYTHNHHLNLNLFKSIFCLKSFINFPFTFQWNSTNKPNEWINHFNFQLPFAVWVIFWSENEEPMALSIPRKKYNYYQFMAVFFCFAWTIATIRKTSNGIQCLKWKLTKVQELCNADFNSMKFLFLLVFFFILLLLLLLFRFLFFYYYAKR